MSLHVQVMLVVVVLRDRATLGRKHGRVHYCEGRPGPSLMRLLSELQHPRRFTLERWRSVGMESRTNCREERALQREMMRQCLCYER